MIVDNTAIRKITSLEKRGWLVSWNNNLHLLPNKVTAGRSGKSCWPPGFVAEKCCELCRCLPADESIHPSSLCSDRDFIEKCIFWKFKQHSEQRGDGASVLLYGCWCSKTNCMCKIDLAPGRKMASFHQIPSQLREHRIWWMWTQRSFIASTSPWTTKGNCCCYFMSSCPWRTGVGSPRALLPTDYNNAKELSIECPSERFKFKGVRRADARPQRLITNNNQSNPDKSFITFGV